MPSNATRGAYFKARARKWLLAQGYQVAEMEIIRWIFTPRGRLATKRDQWGSDLIAMNAAGVVFVQVKGGDAARGGTFPDARRKFAEVTWAPGTRQIVLGFPPRAREPRVVDCTQGETHGESETQ